MNVYRECNLSVLAKDKGRAAVTHIITVVMLWKTCAGKTGNKLL